MKRHLASAHLQLGGYWNVPVPVRQRGDAIEVQVDGEWRETVMRRFLGDAYDRQAVRYRGRMVPVALNWKDGE